MPDRHAHLVGSIPAADTDTAMRLAMDKLGPLLRTLNVRIVILLVFANCIKSDPTNSLV